MKHSKKHSMSERSIEKKLRAVQNTQEGIQGLTVWAIHHHDQAERLVDIWAKVMLDSQAPHTITLMNVCNDIVQNCKRKNAGVYKELFKQQLPDVLSHISQEDAVIPCVQRIFKIWGERLVYEEDVISELQECLISDEAKEKLQQEEIDKKLLAEFKPNKVVESLRGFRRLELDADLKYRQITNLRLDLTNSEAIKQLKDRDHGAEYTKQFEDHSKCLEEFNSDLVKVMQERSALIELLELTEHFYELQYGEALVVANAYKNFGLRVSKQEGQLVQIMKTFPGSPRVQSVSPPHPSLLTTEVIDMEMSDDERGEDEEPPIEPYSPSMLDSPERPVGSPISPNASLTDLDIVKGIAQPYDPMESHEEYNPQRLMDSVYNPKMSLERKNSNDLSTRLQNLVPVQGNLNSTTNDGDGTPTQDEYNDTRKRHSTEEYEPVPAKKTPVESTISDEEWDLAWEVLEETLASKAVSQSNLTTIQPTTDFTAPTSNTTSTPNTILKGASSESGLLTRNLTPVTSLITDQNGAHSAMTSSVTAVMADVKAGVTSLVSRNNGAESLAAADEDPNAKAQREFLERLTKRGPFKPSRYLQKLNQEKEKKPEPLASVAVTSAVTAAVMPPAAAGEGDFQYDCQAPQVATTRPKVEYRIGGVARPPDQPTPPQVVTVVTPTGIPPPNHDHRLTLPATPTYPSPMKPENFTNENFLNAGGPHAGGAPRPEYRPEFPPMDQDMRQFNPARPPPPPPPRPFMNNSAPRTPSGFPQMGKPFANTPPPPPPRPGPPPLPDFGQFPRMPNQNNPRMESPPNWPRGPPPIPPPFFRPRF